MNSRHISADLSLKMLELLHRICRRKMLKDSRRHSHIIEVSSRKSSWLGIRNNTDRRKTGLADGLHTRRRVPDGSDIGPIFEIVQRTNARLLFRANHLEIHNGPRTII